MKGLTSRQQQILDLIRDQIDTFGRPPTRAEIAKTLGFKSVNAAEDHLQALAKKQVIALDSSTSRGIRLLGEPGESPFTHTESKNNEHSVGLPLIGNVSAGSPIFSEEHIERLIPIDPALFNPQAHYLLKVKGLSMKDIGIFDGDLLVVHNSQEAKNGAVVVARINNEVTVKRLIKRQSSIELHAENPDYPPIHINPEHDAFHIEGLAVGLIRQGQL